MVTVCCQCLCPLVSWSLVTLLQVFTCLLTHGFPMCTAHWVHQLLVTLRCSTSTGIQERESKERVTGWRWWWCYQLPQQCRRVSDPRRGWSGAGWRAEISSSHPDSSPMKLSSDAHQLMIFLQQKFDLTRTQKMYDSPLSWDVSGTKCWKCQFSEVLDFLQGDVIPKLIMCHKKNVKPLQVFQLNQPFLASSK